MPLPDAPTNFMHSMFPALDGTFVLTKSDEVERGYTMDPVIAWAPNADNPYRAPIPITIHGMRRLIDSAVLHPSGMVSDPAFPISFSDVDEWLAAKPAKKVSKADPKHQKPVDPEVETEETTSSGEGMLGIMWTGKPYKTNSFWRYTDDDYDFVFTVPAQEPVPKASDELVKIKRDDFMNLKKEVEVMEASDLMDSGEPEAEDDDDDDEGSDLI